MTHYKELGIQKTATQRQIKRAYVDKLLDCHYGRIWGDRAYLKYLRAFNVLIDSDRRKAYNKTIKGR